LQFAVKVETANWKPKTRNKKWTAVSGLGLYRKPQTANQKPEKYAIFAYHK